MTKHDGNAAPKQPMVCQWSFEPLENPNLESQKRNFLTCRDCHSSYIKLAIAGRNCSVCGGSNLERLQVVPKKNELPPIRIANDGAFVGVRTIEDRPIGVSSNTIGLGLSQKKVVIRNNTSRPVFVSRVELPIWVICDAPLELSGVPIHPGMRFELNFSGHLMRSQKDAKGIIEFQNASIPSGNAPETEGTEIQFGFRSLLNFSVVWPTLLVVLLVFLLSAAYLLIALLNVQNEDQNYYRYWFGHYRFTTFAAIGLFLFFTLSTGFLRTLAFRLSNRAPWEQTAPINGTGLYLLNLFERRPYGFWLRFLLLLPIWSAVWFVSSLSIYVLNRIGLFNYSLLCVLAALAYLFAVWLFVEFWFHRYDVNILETAKQSFGRTIQFFDSSKRNHDKNDS